MRLVVLILVVFLSACTSQPNVLSSGVKLDFPFARGSGTVIEFKGDILIVTANHLILGEDISKGSVMWYDSELVSVDNEFGISRC